jgi:signal transduction histidine kinase
LIDTQEIDLLKSEIITTVSHELSTPLVQVKAAVSLLVEDFAQHGSAEQGRIGAMATQAVARLESVIDNIKQLAQTHHIRLNPVTIGDAVDLAVRQLDRSWASRGARERIEKRLDADLPLVWADKRALARLLQLLMDNALKFSPPDSPVRVLAWPESATLVWIGVQDFGIGIPKTEHDQIFEAFYLVDGSSTRRYGGTGTGLALALLLANGMNTTIELDSEPGEGSTFSFTLRAVDLENLPDPF